MFGAQSDDVIEALEAAPDRTRLADALPYRLMGKVAGLDMVHLLEDQSFGIGFEISLPDVSGDPRGKEHVSLTLRRMIEKLEPGYVIQYYRKNSTDVRRYLDLYMSQVGNDKIGRRISEATYKLWSDAIEKGFFPNHALNFFPCKEEFVCMIKAPSSKMFEFDLDEAFALLRYGDVPSKRYLKVAKSFESVIKAIREVASERKLHLSAMDASQFVPFVVSTLAPYSDATNRMPVDSGLDTLSEAVSSAVTVDLTDNDGKVRFDRVIAVRHGVESHHAVISMLWPPEGVEAGMCNDIVYTHPNMVLITTIEMVPQMIEKIKIKASEYLAGKAVTSFTATEVAEKLKSYQQVSKRLFGREKICNVRVQAVVTCRTASELESAQLRVKSAMESAYDAVIEDKFGSSLFMLGTLPFTHDARREKTFKRYRRMLTADIADIIPAGGMWTGIVPTHEYLAKEENKNKPVVMYANEVGGPLFINPDECDSNPHVCVIGGSGSGKTFAVQDYHLQLWRIPQMRAYLISIKPDYVRLANLLGKYIDINLDRDDISINPFGGKPTKTNQAMWTQALCLMVQDGDDEPEARPSKDERVLLSEVCMVASMRNWDNQAQAPIRETLLSDIIAVLAENEEHREMAQRLIHRLKPYHSGAYANLVNRPRSISRDDKFIFFNLAGVVSASCRSVVMFSLFNFINNIMFDPSLIGVSKVVTFDEGWAVIGDKYSASLMEKAARAYRSMGGRAIYISQSFKDFDNDLGRSILANTATKIILPQERNELLSLPNYIELNSYEMNKVSNLKLHKGYYSEFFVKMQGFDSTVGRIVPDPYKYAIATTAPQDEAIHAQLLRETRGDYTAAVDRFANEYPFGRAVH